MQTNDSGSRKPKLEGLLRWGPLIVSAVALIIALFSSYWAAIPILSFDGRVDELNGRLEITVANDGPGTAIIETLCFARREDTTCGPWTRFPEVLEKAVEHLKVLEHSTFEDRRTLKGGQEKKILVSEMLVDPKISKNTALAEIRTSVGEVELIIEYKSVYGMHFRASKKLADIWPGH